jgi:hypothetical protein
VAGYQANWSNRRAKSQKVEAIEALYKVTKPKDLQVGSLSTGQYMTNGAESMYLLDSSFSEHNRKSNALTALGYMIL